MRRLMDATNRAVKRVNVRLAGGAVAAIVCGVAIWQGTGYVRRAPAGPTKQVATGIDQTAELTGQVQPAVASLTDDQLPGQSTPGAYRQMQFTQPADNGSAASPPATNPYLPTNNDPAGGYSPSRSTSSRYSGSLYGQSGENTQPAAIPSDPTSAQPTTEPVPENIYRPSPVENAGSAASAPSSYPPLSQSPYAATSTPSAGGYGAPASDAPTTTSPPTDLTPPATSLSPAELSTSP
jgi:hypothetical protein